MKTSCSFDRHKAPVTTAHAAFRRRAPATGSHSSRLPMRSDTLVATFSEQLAALLEAGMSADLALSVMAAGDNRSLATVACALRRELRRGLTLAGALARLSALFDPVYQRMVAVGEHCGELVEALRRQASERRHAAAQTARLRRALAYPLTVAGIAVSISIAMLGWVVPAFGELFAGFDAPLPAATRYVLRLSQALHSHGRTALAALSGSALLLWLLARVHASTRLALARLGQHVPLLGPLRRDRALARWAGSLACLLASHVPLLEAINAVHGLGGDPRLDAASAQLTRRLRTGMLLSRAMRESLVFPSTLVQCIEVAERAATLDQVLHDFARRHASHAETRIQALTSLLEPLIVGALGLAVGALVLSLYLPIIQMGSLV